MSVSPLTRTMSGRYTGLGLARTRLPAPTNKQDDAMSDEPLKPDMSHRSMTSAAA